MEEEVSISSSTEKSPDLGFSKPVPCQEISLNLLKYGEESGLEAPIHSGLGANVSTRSQSPQVRRRVRTCEACRCKIKMRQVSQSPQVRRRVRTFESSPASGIISNSLNLLKYGEESGHSVGADRSDLNTLSQSPQVRRRVRTLYTTSLVAGVSVVSISSSTEKSPDYI